MSEPMSMHKHNSKNERIKHKYFAYLEEAERMSPSTVDAVTAAISQFEETTNFKDFALFHIEQARRFKRVLNAALNKETGKPLAKSTIRSRLLAVKALFFWLAGQPGYKSRISYSDCEYFNPSANDTRIATARREQTGPEIEQVWHVLGQMPVATAIERRNRAVIAFALLSGARDDAIASLNLGHIDPVRRTIFQDAREVRTKFRKTRTTWFFPVGEGVETLVLDWITYLQEVELFRPNDPLFPMTKIGIDKEGQFAAIGLERRPWTSAGSIRGIFKEAFTAAGLPYFHPHSLRHTLIRLGMKVCRTPEEFKAWSQNLSHEGVLTSFRSYGEVAGHRQAELMTSLAIRRADEPSSGTPDAATINLVLAHLQMTNSTR